jgi:hypothetical protein
VQWMINVWSVGAKVSAPRIISGAIYGDMFAIFHWRCFANYLHAESEPQIESAIWKTRSLSKSN